MTDDYWTHLQQTIRLHRLWDRGLGESAEADDLRDEMDGTWDGMTSHERDIVRQVGSMVGVTTKGWTKEQFEAALENLLRRQIEES